MVLCHKTRLVSGKGEPIKVRSHGFNNTRPKPVEHGYVFSMAVGTIGEWLKLVPFLLEDVQLIGGGGQFFKNKYLGRQTYYGLGP